MCKHNYIDWQKVEAFIKKRKPACVYAGLLDDWYCTAAKIYEKGKWIDGWKTAAYTTSYWATPGFKAKMKNGDIIECVASIER